MVGNSLVQIFVTVALMSSHMSFLPPVMEGYVIMDESVCWKMCHEESIAGFLLSHVFWNGFLDTNTDVGCWTKESSI